MINLYYVLLTFTITWRTRREWLNLQWYQRGRRGSGGCREKCAHGEAQRPVPSKVVVAPESKGTRPSHPIRNTLPVASRYFRHSGIIGQRVQCPVGGGKQETFDDGLLLDDTILVCHRTVTLHWRQYEENVFCLLLLVDDVLWSRNAASIGLGRRRRHCSLWANISARCILYPTAAIRKRLRTHRSTNAEFSWDQLAEEAD